MIQTVIHNVQRKPFISQVDHFKYNELLLDLKNFFRYMKQDFNRLECIDIFGQTDGIRLWDKYSQTLKNDVLLFFLDLTEYEQQKLINKFKFYDNDR